MWTCSVLRAWVGASMKTILRNQTNYLLWIKMIQQTTTNPIYQNCMSDMCLNKYNVGSSFGFLWNGKKILGMSHPVSSHHLTDVVSSMCPMNFAERPNVIPKSPWTVSSRRYYVSFNWSSESCVLNSWTQSWEELNFPKSGKAPQKHTLQTLILNQPCAHYMMLPLSKCWCSSREPNHPRLE